MNGGKKEFLVNLAKSSISQCEADISRRLRFQCKEWIVELTDTTHKNSCMVYFDFP